MEKRNKIRPWPPLLFALVSLFFPGPLWAFTLNSVTEARFHHNTPTIGVLDVDCTYSSGTITAEELLDMSMESMDRFWHIVESSDLEASRDSVRTDAVSGGTESLNNILTNLGQLSSSQKADITITCNTNASNFSNSKDVLGVTSYTYEGDKISDALILINSGSYSGSDGEFVNLSREEQINTLAHEIGHALGLGHTPTKSSLMYFDTSPTRNELGQDDMDGLTYLYPRDDALIKGANCSTVKNIGGGDGRGGPSSDDSLLFRGNSKSEASQSTAFFSPSSLTNMLSFALGCGLFLLTCFRRSVPSSSSISSNRKSTSHA